MNENVSDKAEPWQQPDLFGGVSGPPSKVKKKRQSTVDPVQSAREFGSWTLDKLEVFRTYLTMYRRVAGSGSSYIDAFAAEGAVVVDGTERLGSARIALTSRTFRKLLLIEKDPSLVAKLTERIQSHPHVDRCDIRCGDTNVIIKKALDCGEIDRTKPCFAFLDPDSTQLDWATVEALASYKPADEATGACKIELWVLFNLEQAIQRLWLVDKSQLPPNAKVLDRIMGGRDAWIDLWEQHLSPPYLVFRYQDRLKASHSRGRRATRMSSQSRQRCPSSAAPSRTRRRRSRALRQSSQVA